MVNERVIPGKDLGGRHPLISDGPAAVYVRGAPVICVRAGVSGRLDSPVGIKTFQAGDWICTDSPATQAWVIRDDEFRNQNYTFMGNTTGEPGDALVFPAANTLEALRGEVSDLRAAPPAESIPGVASGTSLPFAEVTHPLTTTADREGGGTEDPSGSALPAQPKPSAPPAPDPSPAAAVNRGPDVNERPRARQTSAPSTAAADKARQKG